MDGSEAERADLKTRLAEIREPVAIHPGLSGIHARKVADLVAALEDTEAAALLRWLIGKIVLTPDATAANLVRLLTRLASGHPDKDIDALTPWPDPPTAIAKAPHNRRGGLILGYPVSSNELGQLADSGATGESASDLNDMGRRLQTSDDCSPLKRVRPEPGSRCHTLQIRRPALALRAKA
nr:hypothetical protein DWF04_15570 [Cereibacter sphaeroides f. sp. denitrificans]